MIKRVVEVASPARLSVRHRQLVVTRTEQPEASVPCEDLGVLVVDHPQVTYTHGVFTTLAEAGAVVVLCGADHLPSGMCLPVEGHYEMAARLAVQLEASLPLRKGLWKATVQAKLRQQAVLLDLCGLEGAGLREMAKRVHSGDPDNLEAQGARRYWPVLLGPEFRRQREGAPPNHLLNYGYIVFRSAMARALTAAGLLPVLGIHHHDRRNAFALADDLLEPYRPIVDWRVRQLVQGGGGLNPELERPLRAALLGLFNETVQMGEERMPLMLAFHTTAVSLVKAYETKRVEELRFPRGMPVQPNRGGDDSTP